MSAFTDYKTALEKSGEITFIPSGNSMWPTLKDRAQSVVVKKKTDRLKEFDVALFEKDGIIALHRVIKVLDGGYQTCGDSQFKCEIVDEDSVFGVMAGFYKGKDYICADDEKYVKSVKNWYKRRNLRRFKVKYFYFTLRVKNFFKKIKQKKGK